MPEIEIGIQFPAVLSSECLQFAAGALIIFVPNLEAYYAVCKNTDPILFDDLSGLPLGINSVMIAMVTA